MDQKDTQKIHSSSKFFLMFGKKILSIEIVIKSTTKKKRKFDRFNDDDDDTIITICCCPIQTVVDGWMDQSFCGSFKCLSTCSQNHKAVYNFDKFDEIITKQQHWIVVKLEKKFDPK